MNMTFPIRNYDFQLPPNLKRTGRLTAPVSSSCANEDPLAAPGRRPQRRSHSDLSLCHSTGVSLRVPRRGSPSDVSCSVTDLAAGRSPGYTALRPHLLPPPRALQVDEAARCGGYGGEDTGDRRRDTSCSPGSGAWPGDSAFWRWVQRDEAFGSAGSDRLDFSPSLGSGTKPVVSG